MLMSFSHVYDKSPTHSNLERSKESTDVDSKESIEKLGAACSQIWNYRRMNNLRTV